MARPGWIGVDLDGTLAHYTTWRADGSIGPPVEKMLARVKQWLADGREVRIVTARVAEVEFRGQAQPAHERAQAQRELVEAWCEQWVGQKLVVTCCKDLDMVALYDDRAFHVIPNTGIVIGETMETRIVSPGSQTHREGALHAVLQQSARSGDEGAPQPESAAVGEGQSG